MEAEPGEVEVQIERVLYPNRIQKDLRCDKVDIFLTKTKKKKERNFSRFVALTLPTHLLGYGLALNLYHRTRLRPKERGLVL